MHRFWRFTALWLAVVSLAAPAARADLEAEVRLEIQRSQITRGMIGVSIRDADSERAALASILWSNGTFSTAADAPLIPASNMKLLTTGAALHALGPDFVFQTRLLRDGNRLIIRGDGDPAFGDPELLATMVVGERQGLSVDDFMALWVEPVAQASIRGAVEIVMDDRIFAREFAHPVWPADQLTQRYCAEVSGFNFHLNVLHFYPRPSAYGDGHPDLSVFEPRAGWLSPRNRATSARGPNDQSTVWIARRPGTNDLTFYGNVKFAYRAPVPVTLHDMPTFFAHLLAERLEQRGVSVRSWRLATEDDGPLTGADCAPIIKTPLAVALARCNTDSQNLYAEALLKRTCYERTRQSASWNVAAAILRNIAHERLALPFAPPDLIVSDGSGLSRENRVAPATLTAWLGSFHRDAALGPVFKASLAIAGENGTLDNRFSGIDLFGAEIRAKSGFINNVSCLSGYVTMPDGRCRAFSVMANDLNSLADVRLAKKLQERIVSAIARDLASVEMSMGSD